MGIPVIRRLRLASGLVMLAYVTTHFINHSLGLVSVRVMDDLLWYLYRVWTSRLGTTALYGSFVVHYVLALWSLWRRRMLRMPPAEAAQLMLGFCIPFLLVQHVVESRVADTWFHADFGYYASLLTLYWATNPWRGVMQLAVLVIAWIHAMIGVRFNLMLKPWYRRWQPVLFAVALLVPTFAIVGYGEAGWQVHRLAQDPAYLAHIEVSHPRARPATDAAKVDAIGSALQVAFAVALGAVLLGRAARWQWRRRHGVVRLHYPGSRMVEILPGLSVLEASRRAGIPHASVCGGRGRCSTCRIRVAGAAGALPAASAEEVKVLQRVRAGPDVRLACQLRPTGDLMVTPLLPPSVAPAAALRRPTYLEGMEKEIAILFADIRNFTRLAEQKLPYDVVFLLNRYFTEMGRAVEQAGGRVDKFIGDGVMALFGLDRGAESGGREALAAAKAMAARLVELNRVLAPDLPAPLRIGIGIHVGPAIVGEMGYGDAVSVTAVGDAVNTASRLEGLTKTYGTQLVVSEALVTLAGLELPAAVAHEIEIRGRVEPLRVYTIDNALDLPDPA